MDDVTQLAFGVAHALVFGIFSVSGTGKLVGCQRGGRIMCIKAGADYAIALASAMFVLPPLTWLAGALAVLLGAGGWIREIVRNNKACNCFGVLTNLLDPLRNLSRALLVVGGAAMLLAPLAGAPKLATQAAGAALGLCLLLVLVVYTLAQALMGRKAPNGFVTPSGPIMPTVQLEAHTFLGTRADGQPTVLGDVTEPGRPLALLLSAANCAQCDVIKADFGPLLGEFPFPFRVIDGNKVDAVAVTLPGARVTLYDPGHTLRRTLALIGVPALVLVDPITLKVARPVVSGADAIRRTLNGLLYDSLRAAPE